jgi:hypothetical protein
LSLGACLAAFDLLPLAEAIRLGANLRSDLAGFLPTPYGNGVAFVAPTTFGPLDPRTPSWVPGGPSNVVDWNAMNACLGISPAVLVTLGWAVQGATWGRRQRLGFRFFSVAGLFLLLRYLQVQPAAAINLLPLPDRQMPKYTVGVVAFCLLVAAALAVDHVRAEPGRRVRWWGLGLAGALAGSVLTLIGQRGGFAAIDGQLAGTYVPATLTIASAVLLGVALARRWPGLPPGRAGVLLIAVLVGELSVYVPLGSRAPELLWARVGLCGLVVLAGVLLAGRRRWGATGLLSAVVVSYGLLVALPTVGLPRQFDVDQPPAFMGWLRTATGDDYRSFGILPDFSSIDGIQDVGVAGPLAPDAFGAFVALVSDPQLAAQYQRTGTFWISSRFSGHASYSLGDYSRARAVLDWVGVRFLVLDRAVFQPGGRTDDQALLESNSGVIVAYEDHAVRILESPQARPKAEFWTGAEVYPDQATVLAQLRQFPDRILGAPILEATGAPSNAQLRNELHARASSARVAPVNVEEYRPNEVRLGVQSPDAGVVVLKDIYSPGWQAWVDGQPSPVLRVDGLVRGVAIAQAGQHEVRFRYQPESFVRGLWVAALTATLLLSSAVSAYLGYLRHGRCQP